jgi:signal transduction histidine kinase
LSPDPDGKQPREGGVSLFDRIFGQPSARVVALARLGLAAVFFLATLADPQVEASPVVVPVLTAFLCFSMLTAYLTWSDWWIDARIARATHIIDVCFFVAIVGSPQGYSSPYFLFFVFLLLSAAIRWTWRATAVTATIVVGLYVIAGLLVGLTTSGPFETRRFIIRSGYLLILSIVLIWFGVRRRFSAGSLPEPAPNQVTPGEPPLVTALRQMASMTNARRAVAFWTSPDGSREAVSVEGQQLRSVSAAAMPEAAHLEHAFLFDAGKDRALVNGASSTPEFTSARAMMGEALVAKLAPHTGMGVPIQSKLGSGLFLLSGIPDLHSDHLALGERLRSDLASLMERYGLFSALRDGAIARERLGIARDLHDGVVQFLAGSAYKIEAISRSSATGSSLADDLEELKQLMLLEQEDLRSSIGTLRKDKVSLTDTAVEARALCERLARQWHVRCSFASKMTDARVPARLHMDLLHMIKEGVANAVRHASATDLALELNMQRNTLKLSVTNDAAASSVKGVAVPWSIRERMAEIGGDVTVTEEEGTTTLLVTIPIPDIAE